MPQRRLTSAPALRPLPPGYIWRRLVVLLTFAVLWSMIFALLASAREGNQAIPTGAWAALAAGLLGVCAIAYVVIRRSGKTHGSTALLAVALVAMAFVLGVAIVRVLLFVA